MPYEFENINSFDPEVLQSVREAIEKLNNILDEHQINIRFVARGALEGSYYKIRYKPDQKGFCSSQVGVRGVGEPTIMTLGPDCKLLGIIIHELMHGLGFWHEHSRSDRDEYIDFFPENLHSRYTQKRSNFNKFKNSINFLSYDYNSIMHYDSFAFAKNQSSPTIVKKGESGLARLIFKAQELSASDIGSIREVYGTVGAQQSDALLETAISGSFIAKPYLRLDGHLYYATRTHFCLSLIHI